MIKITDFYMLCKWKNHYRRVLNIYKYKSAATAWCDQLNMDLIWDSSPESQRNVSGTLLNICHKELRQFWQIITNYCLFLIQVSLYVSVRYKHFSVVTHTYCKQVANDTMVLCRLTCDFLINTDKTNDNKGHRGYKIQTE